VSSIEGDVREMTAAIQFYRYASGPNASSKIANQASRLRSEHRVQVQEAITAVLTSGGFDGDRSPDLTDVDDLGFSIFGDGSLGRIEAEVGEMAVRLLRAHCPEVPLR